MSVISEWFITKQFETDFVDNKKFVTIVPQYSATPTTTNVFNHNGYLSVYCVTNDDNVFKYECFDGEYIHGDGRKNSISVPIKVKQLCQKQVIDIKCGMNFVVALTCNGRVYSWGLNDFGQLGHGNQNNQYLTPTAISTLTDKCVVDISCGSCHCVALTRNGEVFEWGLNCVTDENITVPVQVIGIQYQTIISIACGVYHTLVLTDNGDVFSWGMNSKGQLGIANNTNQCNPCKVDNLNGDKIAKISCGAHHSMLLSESGQIYVFGANNFGQIGDQTIDNKNIPIKLNIDTKFVDIAAPGFYKNQISVAQCSDGFCYVWGKCDELTVKRPVKTEFRKINEVMMKYSKYKVTYKLD